MKDAWVGVDVGTSRIRCVALVDGQATATEVDAPPLSFEGAIGQSWFALQAAAHRCLDDLAALVPRDRWRAVGLTTQRGAVVHAASDRVVSWLERSEQVGIPLHQLLAEVLDATHVGGDKNVELWALGVDAPGKVAASFGTALSIGTLVDAGAPPIAGTFRTPSVVGGLDNVEIGLPSGGVLHPHVDAWFRAPGGLPSPSDPIALVGFAGTLMHPASTGAIVGITLSTSPETLAAVVWEGVVLELMAGFSRLPGVDPSALKVTGGAATPRLCGWLADALQLPVEVAEPAAYGALGAARLVARTHDTLVPMPRVPVARAFTPQPDHADRWATRLAMAQELSHRLFDGRR